MVMMKNGSGKDILGHSVQPLAITGTMSYNPFNKNYPIPS